MYRKYIGLIGLVVIMAFSSCHSSKKGIDYSDDIYRPSQEVKIHLPEIKPEQPKGTKSTYRYLSDRLGLPINSKDNIELYETAARWMHTPYKYGGNTRKGVDCSGLVCNVYKSVYHRKLERRSVDIFYKNCSKISKRDLREGDLVFFATGKNKNRINHVGIYLKKDKFIHASSSKGVIVSNLNDAYYRRTYFSSGKVN